MTNAHKWREPEWRARMLAAAFDALRRTPDYFEWTDDMTDVLRQLRADGATYAECAKAIGCCEKTVHRHLIRLGLPTRRAKYRCPVRAQQRQAA